MKFENQIIIQRKDYQEANLRDYNFDFHIEYEILIFLFRKARSNEIVFYQDLMIEFCKLYNEEIIKSKLDRIISSGIIEEHRTENSIVLSFNTAVYNSPEILLAILMGV